MSSKQKISVQKYFKTRLKNLPYHECYINAEYKERGLAQILISKKQASGKYAYAIFLLDVYCLGLKNCMYNFNFDDFEYEQMKDKLFSSEGFMLLDIVAAHNLIYGTIDAAEEIGFKPHKDFAITEHILNPDLIDDGIDDIELEKDGKILYISGPYDNVDRILQTLYRTVGEGNFDFMDGFGEDEF